MKIVATILLALLFALPAASAQKKEEIETYLVAPYTLNKLITVTMVDGQKVQGRVVGGDDDKIIVERRGSQIELRTDRILNIRLLRATRSPKVILAGNLIGGMGLGFAGAALGKAAAETIRDDDQPGRIGPLVGGIVLGFAGGYLGKEIARNAAYDEVIVTVTRGVEGQAPKTGAILLPTPDSNPRVQPVDLRR